MRSTKLYSVLGLLLLASLMVSFVGCGSDNSPTGTVGSLTDPEFIAIQGQIETFTDSTMASILTGLGSMSSISSGGSVDPIYYGPVYPDSDQVTISYVNGWHVVNLLKSRTNFSFNILDSVQFYANDSISQSGVDVDSLWYRHHWAFGMPDTTATNIGLAGITRFDFRGIQTGIANINGTNDFNASSKLVTLDSTVWRSFELNATASDLVIEKVGGAWQEARPTSGSITANLTMTYTKDANAPIVTDWTITLVFTSGAVSETVQSGTVTWTYTFYL